MSELPSKKPRVFVSKNLNVQSWNDISKYFEDLLNRNLHSIEDLKLWLSHRSELDAVLEEDMAWRYIKMCIDTKDKNLSDDFNFFVREISPKISSYSNKLDKKLNSCNFFSDLEDSQYKIYKRSLRNSLDIFREENVKLKSQMTEKEQEYGSICAKMSVDIDGVKMTMQEASEIMKDNDRSKRESAYLKIWNRRLEDKEKLDLLFDKLIVMRQNISYNADFNNYRDYKFKELGRFDYNVDDCFEFHKSIKESVVPVISQWELERKTKLNLDVLKPWDLSVDTSGKQPLKPFKNEKDLIDKTIKCLNKIDPYFGWCIDSMHKMGHLDLSSKIGKAPGGFNYPLYEIGVPFIYMNSVGSSNDVTVMLHEGGHAVHSFLSRDLELTQFKGLTSEIAELASMSMELISMDGWDVFYDNQEDLNRAKRQQLRRALNTMPWVAMVDAFQHWVYTSKHNNSERITKWSDLQSVFSPNVDWSGVENMLGYQWQKQLHLYEVPFYYIEYAMAQLGAIAVWKNYKTNKNKALDQYKSALSLGYTKNIGEIYETAGIEFNFSSNYIKELCQFVISEYNNIK